MKNKQLKTFTVVIALALAAVHSHAQNLLVNGSFDSGDLYYSHGKEYGTLDGWTVIGHYTDMSAPVESGPQALNLNDGMTDNNGGLAILSQSVSTVVGDTYTFSAWIEADANGANNELDFLWNGATALQNENFSTDGYQEFMVNVTATAAATVLGFAHGNNNGQLYLDNASLTLAAPVPEPAATTLAVFGGAGLILIRRQK